MANTKDDIIHLLIHNSTVNPETSCLEWSTPNKNGYFLMHYKGGSLGIHRLSYLFWNGALEKGKVIMHTCDNRKCWNPKHLVQGTYSDNRLDCLSKGRWNVKKTHCKRGHEFTLDNTMLKKAGRACRECNNMYMVKYNRRRAAIAKSK